jgi:hypothetical protein
MTIHDHKLQRYGCYASVESRKSGDTKDSGVDLVGTSTVENSGGIGL